MTIFRQPLLTGALTATIMLGACSSTPVAVPPAQTARPAPTPAVQAPASTQATAPVAATKVASIALEPYLDPNSQLNQKRSIYFDFDQAAVKTDYAPLLELHGKYLASHPGVAIAVQGNADERGGAEYNLALGQKRAEAVVKSLKIYGVKDTQMEAVSFGKEKPKAMGHDEAAYALNRRADLAYPGK
jgi:peptidoglycan-associated lipoprotein